MQLAAPRPGTGYKPVIGAQNPNLHPDWAASGHHAVDFSPVKDAILNVATLGEHSHPGGLRDYGNELRQSFDWHDPRAPLQLEGLLGGPRTTSSIGSEGMGFGHAEKEFPSVLPGHVLQRAAHGEGYVSYEGHEVPTVLSKGIPSEYRLRASERGVPVTYNLKNGLTGETVGSISMDVHRDSTYVGEAWIKESYRKSRAIFDFLRILRGTGKPVHAAVVNDELATALSKLSKRDPQFTHFGRSPEELASLRAAHVPQDYTIRRPSGSTAHERMVDLLIQLEEKAINDGYGFEVEHNYSSHNNHEDRVNGLIDLLGGRNARSAERANQYRAFLRDAQAGG